MNYLNMSTYTWAGVVLHSCKAFQNTLHRLMADIFRAGVSTDKKLISEVGKTSPRPNSTKVTDPVLHLIK